MEIAAIKEAINRWNQIRNTNIGLTFLTSGVGFEISREEYEKWQEHSPSNLHVYIGLVEFELMFFVVDNVTDESGSGYEKFLFTKGFTKNYHPNANATFDITKVAIDDNEALHRSFHWLLGSRNWFEHDKSNNKFFNEENDWKGIVRAFEVPFEDLMAIFKTGTEQAFAFLAIRPPKPTDPTTNNLIEIILCNEPVNNGANEVINVEIFKDITVPVPPFKPLNIQQKWHLFDN